MASDILHVGFSNVVVAHRVVVIVAPDSLPVRRMIREARDKGLLVDASRGRKVKSVIVLDDGHVVASALHTTTIARRLEKCKEPEDYEDARAS